jgi:hypothetical protein
LSQGFQNDNLHTLFFVSLPFEHNNPSFAECTATRTGSLFELAVVGKRDAVVVVMAMVAANWMRW